MLYIILAIVMFGILVALHEFGHFITAKLLGVRVNEFSIGMGPSVWNRQKGETLYSIRVLPVGGYCAMEGEDEDSDDPAAFNSAAGWKKLIILLAGAAMNFLTGLVLAVILMAPAVAFVTPVIDSFADGFPYQGEEGLMAGDRIVSIDGHAIYLYSDVTMFFSRSNGETMDLVVERNGERVKLDDFPLKSREYTQDGQTSVRYGLNFRIGEATIGSKLMNAWYTTIDFVRLVWISLGDLISGAAGLRDLSGPVGIVSTIGEVGTQSASVGDALYNIAYFAALIAVNLAVMNLLPLPALDGGRIFFLLLNGLLYLVCRRKIAPKYEGYVHLAGLAALMCLMLAVTFSDIGKLFGH